MQRDKVIQDIRQKALPILQEAGVTHAALFGSVARGEQTKKSDVDFLIEFPREKSLLAFAHLKTQLEEALQKPVDLVEYGAIREELKPYILPYQVPIL